MTESPEDDTVLGLYRLSEWVLSLLQDARYGRVQVAALAITYAKVSDALELLNNYEKASTDGNDDLAHEFGMSYSELMADVEDLMTQLKDDGIVIRMQ